MTPDSKRLMMQTYDCLQLLQERRAKLKDLHKSETDGPFKQAIDAELKELRAELTACTNFWKTLDRLSTAQPS